MSPAITVSVHVPRPVAVPRGAKVVGLLIDRLRARKPAQPAQAGSTLVPTRLREDAARVRSLAASIVDREPGHASDLRAAADRSLVLADR